MSLSITEQDYTKEVEKEAANLRDKLRNDNTQHETPEPLVESITSTHPWFMNARGVGLNAADYGAIVGHWVEFRDSEPTHTLADTDLGTDASYRDTLRTMAYNAFESDVLTAYHTERFGSYESTDEINDDVGDSPDLRQK